MVQVLGSWISWYLQPRSSLTKMNQELNSLNNILELAIFLCPFSLKEPQDKKKKIGHVFLRSMLSHWAKSYTV